MSDEEQGYLTTLIPYPSGSIEVDNENHTTFEAAKKSLETVLTERFDGKLFFRNWAWIFGGAALFLAVIMATGAAASWGAGGSERFALPLAVAAIGMVFRFVPAFARMSGKSLLVGAAAIGLIFLMVVSGAPLLFRALEEGNFWPFLPLAVGLPLVLSSFWWMPSPTVEGQKLIDRILGFKHYLSVTEANQLDRMHPPADTPELFEKFLPYAIALDVENRWAKRFTSVLAAASATPAAAGGFAWYSGSDSPWNDATGFTRLHRWNACQHLELSVDRARIIERFGRRWFLRRRRRRRWRRRLVGLPGWPLENDCRVVVIDRLADRLEAQLRGQLQ